MSTSSLPDLPRRADALRNRAKVLDAARGAFAELGLEAQVEDIAARAGVGVGTVYRHFPTKEALIGALARDHFTWLADLNEAALSEQGDPWEILRSVLWRAAEHTAGDEGLCQIIAMHPVAMQAAADEQARLRELGAELVARARSTGQIREDAHVNDIRTIMIGFGHVAVAQRLGAPVTWQRYLTLALDGLRAR